MKSKNATVHSRCTTMPGIRGIFFTDAGPNPQVATQLCSSENDAAL